MQLQGMPYAWRRSSLSCRATKLATAFSAIVTECLASHMPYVSHTAGVSGRPEKSPRSSTSSISSIAISMAASCINVAPNNPDTTGPAQCLACGGCSLDQQGSLASSSFVPDLQGRYCMLSGISYYMDIRV